MVKLEKIIQPGIGVFTNIGDAHGEGFLSVDQKIAEKLNLFVQTDVLIYGTDYPNLEVGVNQFIKKIGIEDHCKVFCWGKKESALLELLGIQKEKHQTIISAHDHRSKSNDSHSSLSSPISITIPFTDDASIQNAITCWCVLLHLQIPTLVIQKRMLQLKAVEMRLELKQGINNC
jgi:alanine racemase